MSIDMIYIYHTYGHMYLCIPCVSMPQVCGLYLFGGANGCVDEAEEDATVQTVDRRHTQQHRVRHALTHRPHSTQHRESTEGGVRMGGIICIFGCCYVSVHICVCTCGMRNTARTSPAFRSPGRSPRLYLPTPYNNHTQTQERA